MKIRELAGAERDLEEALTYYWASLKIQISSQLLHCRKNFLLTYRSYAARRNFLCALHLSEL